MFLKYIFLKILILVSISLNNRLHIRVVYYLLINVLTIFLAKLLYDFLVEKILLALIPFYIKLVTPPSKIYKFDNSVNVKMKTLSILTSIAVDHCLNVVEITVKLSQTHYNIFENLFLNFNNMIYI